MQLQEHRSGLFINVLVKIARLFRRLLSLVTCFVLGLLQMFYRGFIYAIWDINQFKFILNCQTIPLYLSNEENLCSPAQVRRLVSHMH